MLYLLLCCFLMIMGLAVVIRSVFIRSEGEAHFAPLIALAMLFLTLAVISPFYIALVTFSLPVNLQQMSRLSVATQWAGGICALLLFGLYAWQAYKASRRFWTTGAAVAAAILAFIFVDSLLFVSNKDMGVLSTVVVNEGGVNDVNCERAFILIHRGQEAPTVWRCPTGLILLADTHYPFLPWPDYRQGQSASLSSVIDTLLHYAKKP